MSELVKKIDNVIASPTFLTLAEVVQTGRDLARLLESETTDTEYVHKCEESIYLKFIRSVALGEYKINEVQELAKNVAALNRLKYRRSY